MKAIINTTNAPAPIGPYSQAVAAAGLLFVSGQIPMNPATGKIISADIIAETTMVMENLKAILNEAGIGFDQIIKSTIFLTDMGTFAQVNEVYGSYFSANFPARETVQVSALPKNVNVEISVIALKP
jgi:2-iminobutanoate/2-iminopropanoate deaminase